MAYWVPTGGHFFSPVTKSVEHSPSGHSLMVVLPKFLKLAIDSTIPYNKNIQTMATIVKLTKGSK
jgi:hypothetical protein